MERKQVNRRCLVWRLSAMGDVVMLANVLAAAVRQYPDVHFFVATRPFFATFFEPIEQVTVLPVDTKKELDSISKLGQWLSKQLTTHQIDTFIDVHNVLRSKLAGLFARFKGLKVVTLDKQRKAKKERTRLKNKERTPLPDVFTQYATVFEQAGFPLAFEAGDILDFSKKLPAEFQKSTSLKIGIAPFAMHIGKQYGLSAMRLVLEELLILYPKAELLVFGGPADKEEATLLCKDLSNVNLTIGKHSLAEELAIIQELDVMLCMDSSNMHMARLVGTPVVAIWGATHPLVGFRPFNEKEKVAYIQLPIKDLECRPCSTFGNKPCFRGDLACIKGINPLTIVRAIEYLIIDKKSR